MAADNHKPRPADPSDKSNPTARKAAHLSSAHKRNDPRIFHKQCVSLASNGWHTTLIVADDMGQDCTDGVHIVDVGRADRRWRRMTLTPWRLYRKALELDAAVYQLHDPEMLPVGLLLKLRGKRVIFDSHEHYPKAMLSKTYVAPRLRGFVAKVYAVVERFVCRRFDGIVAANPWIQEHFATFHANSILVDNYPRLEEFSTNEHGSPKCPEVCYIGELTAQRGVVEMVSAMDHVKSGVRLRLAGRFVGKEAEESAKSHPGWRRVEELGYLDRAEIQECLRRSIAGLVTLQPEPNYLELHPTKLFEYMGAGIPAIASDFPVWRALVDEIGCGICVDPLDPVAIAHAIDQLANDPLGAAEMGRNGRKAIEERFNWGNEERKLLAMYEELVA